MKYYIGIFRTNWADEMDIEGFRLFTQETKKELEKAIVKLKNYTFIVGSNETIDFEKGKDLLDCIEFIEVGEITYNSLYVNMEELGFFPDLWDIEGNEDEEEEDDNIN